MDESPATKPRAPGAGAVLAWSAYYALLAVTVVILAAQLYGVNLFQLLNDYKAAAPAQAAPTALSDAATGIAARIRTVVQQAAPQERPAASQEVEAPALRQPKDVTWDGKLSRKGKAVEPEPAAVDVPKVGKETSVPLETHAAAPEPTAAKQPRAGKEIRP